MKQLPEFIAPYKIIASKHYSEGSTFIIELTSNMLAIIVYRNLFEEPIYSRVYPFNELNKKDIMLTAKRKYNFLKKCLMQKKYECIEDLS